MQTDSGLLGGTARRVGKQLLLVVNGAVLTEEFKEVSMGLGYAR